MAFVLVGYNQLLADDRQGKKKKAQRQPAQHMKGVVGSILIIP